MNKKDLRTEGQKARDARNEQICKEYVTLRREQNLVSKNRVLSAVAKNYGLSGQCIKNILVANGSYI